MPAMDCISSKKHRIIQECHCSDYPSSHAHCHCSVCQGKAVHHSTEYRHDQLMSDQQRLETMLEFEASGGCTASLREDTPKRGETSLHNTDSSSDMDIDIEKAKQSPTSCSDSENKIVLVSSVSNGR